MYLFLSIFKKAIVIPRIANELSFKKGNVKYGSVVVDELEEVYLKRKRVIEFCLRP